MTKNERLEMIKRLAIHRSNAHVILPKRDFDWLIEHVEKFDNASSNTSK